MKNRQKLDRFVAIDGLRGIAILWVTMHHLFLMSGAPKNLYLGPVYISPLFAFGAAGVDLFFALSGFCLYYPLIKNGWKPDWKRFYIRRAIRIYPAYLFALAVFFPIYVSATHGERWLFHLVTHLSFTYMLFHASSGSINGVLWSLGTEDHFYMLFPIFAYLMYRWPKQTLSVSAMISACVLFMVFCTHADNRYAWYLSCLMPARIVQFAVGMFVAHIYAHGVNLSKWNKLFWAGGLFGVLGMPWMLSWFRDGHILYSGWDSSLPFAPCWGLLILAAIYTKRKSPLSFRPLVCVGVISYSLYLYQDMMELIPRTLFGYAPDGSLRWILLALISVCVCGLISFYIAELPFMKLRERFRSYSKDDGILKQSTATSAELAKAIRVQTDGVLP